MRRFVCVFAKPRPAATIDEGSRFNSDVPMNDVTRHAGSVGKNDFLGFDLAVNRSG